MIEYNTKNWLLVVFNFHRTHVIRVLSPSVFVMGLYTALVIFISDKLLHSDLNGSTVVHSLLGIVLGLLLVFRTNTAYERWWEGRKHWGALVNDSRNFAIKLNSFLDKNDSDNRKFFATGISNFCISLKEHLRNGVKPNILTKPENYNIENKKHIPNAIAGSLFNKTNGLYKENQISGDQLIIIDKHIKSFTDITGACERIRNTPIPYSYNLHLKKYIFFYVITLPWGLMPSMKYWAVPAVMLIFYAMVGIELIGEEIEDPFGYDADDLPLDKISENIKNNVHEILNVQIDS